MNTPRRARLDQWTPAEHAIAQAVEAVERAGADERLTDAVVLLQAAKDSVADCVDGIRRRRYVVAFDRLPAPHEKYVVVSNEMVAELQCAPSKPVTVQIVEGEGGRLQLSAIRFEPTDEDAAIARVRARAEGLHPDFVMMFVALDRVTAERDAAREETRSARNASERWCARAQNLESLLNSARSTPARISSKGGWSQNDGGGIAPASDLRVDPQSDLTSGGL